MYTHSVEQSREQSVSVQTLQQQIQEKDGELARARANHQQQVQDKDDELERARANHETELQHYSHKNQENSDELERARAIITEHESLVEQLRKENDKLRQQQEQPTKLARAKILPVSLLLSQ